MIVTLCLNAYTFSIGTINDDTMNPMLRKAGYPFSDRILYAKVVAPNEKLQN